MSRVLKSSQVILDKNKYKLPPSALVTNIPIIEKQEEVIIDQEAIEAEAEEMISKKMEEINELYENTISDARDEANRIIAEAYEKSKEVMEQARNEGFDEGNNKGFEEGKLVADSIIQEALAIKKQTELNMKSLVKAVEEDIIKLATSTIEKILNKKIEEEYDTILGLIQIGLEKCAFTEDLVLRVSPDDYDFAISSKDKILTLSQNINDIIVKQDKSLSKGSCIIDTSSGSIDSSIWTQFNQVKETFEELLKSE